MYSHTKNMRKKICTYNVPRHIFITYFILALDGPVVCIGGKDLKKMEGVNPDSEVQVTINRPIRIIHFSDGVEEEIEEEKVNELQSAPETEQSVDPDPKSLSWGPWFSHYAWKSGSSVLNAVDYAGESLASFFGITTPKYQIEIDEHERIQEEKRIIEEESAGWVPRNEGGNIPLVMTEPSKIVKESEPV